jgi:hypothetical protein
MMWPRDAAASFKERREGKKRKEEGRGIKLQ